jgi:trehalose 6-phosphate phosphatase
MDDSAPARLPPDLALLLDLDGTLLDIAPTPDAVTVPPALPAILARLRARCGGALAIVTGRPVETVETLLPDIPTAVAGEHGGAIRFAPGETLVRAPLPELPAAWLDVAAEAVALHPGALLERKARGFAVHYRLAPAAGPALGAVLARLLDGTPTHRLLPAHMAWEVEPRGADKGTAVRAIMGVAPFAGRRPLYVGDDVTDEDGIAAAEDLGGSGLRVAPVFGDATGVRRWLSAMADGM